MFSAMCSFDLIATLRGGPYNIVTQLRDNPSCNSSFLECICARGDFLGANSCAPTSSHSSWECIYLSLVPCTWFSLPSHGSYLSQGLPAVAWVLHESGYPLLVLELWAWSHLSLLFITVLRYWGLSRCRPLHGLSYPWVSGGGTVGALTLATPYFGDTSPWRRLTLAAPHLGDAYARRRLKRSTCWLPPLGPLEGSHHMLTLILTLTLVNARGRDGHKPPVLSWHLFQQKD